MRRREFIAFVGSTAVAWPLAVRAQQPAMPMIGFLNSASPETYAPQLAGFRQGLKEVGYTEGQNVAIEFRWAKSRYDRLPELAADLVRRQVAVIAATGGSVSAIAAKSVTVTIPIVFTSGGDPVRIMAKRIEMLKDVIPHISQIAIPVKPDNAFFTTALRALQAPAKSLNITLRQIEMPGPNEFAPAFAKMAESGVDAFVILEDAVFVSNARAIVDLAAKQRLPSAGFSEYGEAGGLIGYGIDFIEMYRRAGVFVDKILKGTKPADIPVEQATKFVVVINKKTARALGLDVPPTLLVRADEVIE